MQKLPINTSVPAQNYLITLDGQQWKIRFVWRDRTASWYMDLADVDGVYLLRGRRLSPGSSPQDGMITNGPKGALFIFGADPYAMDEIEIFYFTKDELDEASAATVADGLPVTLK